MPCECLCLLMTLPRGEAFSTFSLQQMLLVVFPFPVVPASFLVALLVPPKHAFSAVQQLVLCLQLVLPPLGDRAGSRNAHMKGQSKIKHLSSKF